MAREASMEIADRSYFFWRGGLSILMGILVLAWPSLTVLVFVTFISIWLFLLGVVNIVEGVRKVGKGGWGWLGSLAVGFVELGVGAYLIQRPGVTTLTIISLIGLVFVVQGLAFIAKTFLDPVASGGHRVLSLLFGGLSLAAGIWVWRYPYHGTLAFVWLVGLYALASGALMLAMGWSDRE
jgi:uncharacterized membrane protein HdeD (DUF308 family)